MAFAYINKKSSPYSIDLRLKESENLLIIEAYLSNIKISSYRFFFSHAGHGIGKELVKAALLSWATIDLCFSRCINVHFSLTENIVKYVKANFKLVSSTYCFIYNKKKASLRFRQRTKLTPSSPIVLDKDSFFLGNTGGRDSTLCKHILKKAQKLISYYKISYDNDPPSPDGHVDMEVDDPDVYNKISITGIKKNSTIVSSHQADDIHVSFVAPYFNLRKNMPANLAVGLPWESIHRLSDGIPDLVPTESYASIKILMDLFHSFNLKNFQIISPIASLHSMGVYKLLGKIIGVQSLLKLDSCWNSTSFLGEPCGACPKCQRLKFIFQYVYQENYCEEAPTLDIKNADFLFGSLYGQEVIQRYPEKNLADYSLLDKTSSDFSRGYDHVIKKYYDTEFLNVRNLCVTFYHDKQTWEDILKQIVNALEINYNDLNDDLLHTEGVPFLPFEKDYKWGRQHQILKCYGGFEAYDPVSSQWTHIGVTGKGPSLKLPNLPIFRKWLDLTLVKKWFPNLNPYNSGNK